MTTIRETLLETITNNVGPTDWDDLMTAVKDSHKIRKNGWMAVRNELQVLINEHRVYRCAGVHQELYLPTAEPSHLICGDGMSDHSATKHTQFIHN